MKKAWVLSYPLSVHSEDSDHTRQNLNWIAPVIKWSRISATFTDGRFVSFTWAATWQNQQSYCAPSEDSDQPGLPPSLIRVFPVRMKKPWVLSNPLSKQQRLWSDWTDAQADLSLRLAHIHFVGFVMSWLTSFYSRYLSRSMTKPTKWPVCQTKTHISLGIRLVWLVFAVRMKKPWILSYPLRVQQRLIRLGGCPGWSELSLGAQVILLVLSCCGTNYSLDGIDCEDCV